MDEELARVTEWLLCASAQIGDSYFQLPVAGRENPEYRERVYCYELYHRWRSHWSDGFPFSLGGEVDKAGHRLIRGDWKPDFLVHVPGRMNNLLIVEVKPDNVDRAGMIADLKKLTHFRRNLKDQYGHPGNYFAAYFWLYGLPIAEWPRLRNDLLVLLDDAPDFDRTLVSCFIHEKPSSRAMQVPWFEADR